MSFVDRHRLEVTLGFGIFSCALVAGLISDLGWLRLAFALPLMFVLPGWAIWRALDIGDRRDPLRAATYAIGLSLAISVLTAVALALIGVLSAPAYALALGAVGLGAVAAGVARGRSDEPAPRPSPAPTSTRNVGWGPIVTVGIALLLIAGAVGVARTPLPVPDDRGYTELSFGPVPEDASWVPVRVASSEAEERDFVLRITRPNGATETRPLTLAPGDVVEERANYGAGASGRLRVELLEPTEEGLAVYRRLRLSLPAAGPAPRSQDIDDQP